MERKLERDGDRELGWEDDGRIGWDIKGEERERERCG